MPSLPPETVLLHFNHKPNQSHTIFHTDFPIIQLSGMSGWQLVQINSALGVTSGTVTSALGDRGAFVSSEQFGLMWHRVRVTARTHDRLLHLPRPPPGAGNSAVFTGRAQRVTQTSEGRLAPFWGGARPRASKTATSHEGGEWKSTWGVHLITAAQMVQQMRWAGGMDGEIRSERKTEKETNDTGAPVWQCT